MRRRTLLQLGLGALAAATLPRPARARRAPQRLLGLFTEGGWDTTYVFDPHLDTRAFEPAPDTTLATVQGIAFGDAADRPAVRATLQQHGARIAFVNGVSISSISHAQCQRLLFNGGPDLQAADFPAWVGWRGAVSPLGRLALSGPRFPGLLGSATTPLTPVFAATLSGALPEGVEVDEARRAGVESWLEEATRARGAATGDAIYARHRDALARAQALRPYAAALDLPEGASEGEELACAVSALAQGLASAVSVQAQLPGIVQWDSHSDNAYHQPRAYEHTFSQLGALLDLLEATPGPDGLALLDTTMVVVLSEMGRTPALNGNLGKDHWPVTSVLLAGAGVAGGQVVGATDEALGALPVDPGTGAPTESGAVLTPAALWAGLLSTFGLDPAEALPGATPFTAPFAGAG